MRAFYYCRVSTEEQPTDDHYSLENQEKKARDQAKLRDWHIVKLRKDVASGKDTKPTRVPGTGFLCQGQGNRS